MDLKKLILEELVRLDEMAGWSTGGYRSIEDQVVLDELMKRDDWENILTTSIRYIENLTDNEKKVIQNYKKLQRRLADPMYKEKAKKYSATYHKSEKGIESQKKQYGAGATQTEEEKEAAKEKYYGRKKIWSKRPTSIQILKKSHKKYRENNPEKVKQANLNWLNKPGNLERKRQASRDYKSNPLWKASEKIRRSSPKYKARRNELQRKRRLLKRQEALQKQEETKI